MSASTEQHTKISMKLGRIGYLNVLPIYEPIESGDPDVLGDLDFEIVSGPPSYLNDRMAAGELPISSMSSVEYGRRHEQYLLIPDLGIGSRGPVQSVLLLSRKPIKELNGGGILVSAQTHTSATLLRMLLADHYGLDSLRYTTGNATAVLESGERPQAILCIGDEALTLRRHPDYPVRLDLGEAWREWTGLPFIFGLWGVSRKAFQEQPAQLRAAARALLASKRAGVAKLPSLLPAVSQTTGMTVDELTDYFAGLVYDLGPEELDGLRAFYAALARHGIIDSAPALEFIDI
ncbi:menaquinone biosynthetic enzyme MqnA/MqnD family protein [Oceanidesulfovibrio marinus]|uniref:Chorismate dehydratase n=1 Tax=Oceanidesulfovibrio marinus TaxID=370038 RepID=A0A6P1ZJK3_9BACT|nr:menaquinone biosynthesis protein [Oceanidesulfovibrio marinus]TVM35891.1 hypothetical protein DQK91_04345 [Oceanidesulfovibrio marinus]